MRIQDKDSSIYPKRMNVTELREWIAGLPADFDTAEVTTLVHSGGMPLNLKRVVAGHYSGERIVILNPMGTHFSDEQWREISHANILSP